MHFLWILVICILRMTSDAPAAQENWTSLALDGAKSFAIDLPAKGELKLERVEGGGQDIQIRSQGGGAPLGSEFIFRRDGLIARLEMSSSAEAVSPLKLEVRVPTGVPVNVVWGEGTVMAQSLRQPLTVMMTRGRFISENHEDELKVNLREGSISVTRLKGGPAFFETYSGSLEIQGATAHRVRVRNFSGKTVISNLSAALNFETYKGVLSLQGAKGNIDLKSTQSSQLSVVDVEGDLHANIDQSTLVARVKEKVAVRVESSSGSVNLSVPSSSGARVTLSSDEGRLSPPKNLNIPDKVRSGKAISGRLPGEGSGHVSLRSQSGDLKVQVY